MKGWVRHSLLAIIVGLHSLGIGGPSRFSRVVARGLLGTIVRLINLVVDGSQYFGGNVAFCLPRATFGLEKLDI